MPRDTITNLGSRWLRNSLGLYVGEGLREPLTSLGTLVLFTSNPREHKHENVIRLLFLPPRSLNTELKNLFCHILAIFFLFPTHCKLCGETFLLKIITEVTTTS